MARGRRNGSRFVVSCSVVLTLALSACAKGGQADRASGTLQVKVPVDELPRTPAVVDVRLGPLEPGTYVTRHFFPRLTLAVGAGWGVALDRPDYLELYRTDAGDVAGFRGMKFIWATDTFDDFFVSREDLDREFTKHLRKVPADAVGWLRSIPYLEAGKPEPIRVGTHTGQTFLASVRKLPTRYFEGCGPTPCLLLLNTDDFRVSLKQGTKSRFVVVPVPIAGRRLIVAEQAPPGGLNQLADEAVDVLRRLRFR